MFFGGSITVNRVGRFQFNKFICFAQKIHFVMCNSEYILSVQSQPPFAVESIIVYLLVLLLSFPVAYFPGQENLGDEYEKTEAFPAPVDETQSQVPQQEEPADESADNCGCVESNESHDSFVSAEDNELFDGNLTSKRSVDQKMNELEDRLKALMKPWNVVELDSSDQQSTSDYVMETTNYCQSDDGNDNIEVDESIASELGEILSRVLQNTFLSDSVHDDDHDEVTQTTPTVKVAQSSDRQTSPSASDERVETEMTQFKPGYSAILDSILSHRGNDCTLDLDNIEPPFAVEYISKEEARRRRWLPPKKKGKDSCKTMPRIYEYEWDDKDDSHSKDPTTNVYYCVRCQRNDEGGSCFKTFVEKSSPRKNLNVFKNIRKGAGKHKIEQCSYEQSENIINDKCDENIQGDGAQSEDCEGSTKSNDRVLSRYQELLVCGHIPYLNKLKDSATLSREGPGDMSWKNRSACIEQKSVCLPEKISKCGLHRKKKVFREVLKENQYCESDINDYDTNGEERNLHEEYIIYPSSKPFESKGTTNTRFDRDNGANVCSRILPEIPRQSDACKDYKPVSGNFALKSDVPKETSANEETNFSSLPVSNSINLHEEIDTAVVYSHDQERFIASQSFRINDIPSVSRKRLRATGNSKDDTSDEYSSN